MVHALAPAQILALAAPLLGWRLYRRIHRNISRQPVQPRRLALRGGIVTLVLGVLVVWPAFDPAVALAMLAGAAIGVPLALYGLRLTRFEHGAQGQFYTPNLYLGLGISLLFVSRMAWRFYVLWPLLQAGDVSLSHVYSRSPLTYGLLALVLAYFATYSFGIIRAARKARAQPSAEPASVKPL